MKHLKYVVLFLFLSLLILPISSQNIETDIPDFITIPDTWRDMLTSSEFELMGSTYRVRYYPVTKDRLVIVPVPTRIEDGMEVPITDPTELDAVVYYSVWDFHNGGLFTIDWARQADFWQEHHDHYNPRKINTAEFLLIGGRTLFSIALGDIFGNAANAFSFVAILKSTGQAIVFTQDVLEMIDRTINDHPGSNEFRAVVQAWLDLDPAVSEQFEERIELEGYLDKRTRAGELLGLEYDTLHIGEILGEGIQLNSRLPFSAPSMIHAGAVIVEAVISAEQTEMSAVMRRAFISNHYHTITLVALANRLEAELAIIDEPALFPHEVRDKTATITQLVYDYYAVMHELMGVFYLYMLEIKEMRFLSGNDIVVFEEGLIELEESVIAAYDFLQDVQDSLGGIARDYDYFQTLNYPNFVEPKVIEDINDSGGTVGSGDIRLLYNNSKLFLVSDTNEEPDISGLTFVGDQQVETFAAEVWRNGTALQNDIEALPENTCVQVATDYDTVQRDNYPCRFHRGWVTVSLDQQFWNEPNREFFVVLNNEAIATCEVSARECAFDVPDVPVATNSPPVVEQMPEVAMEVNTEFQLVISAWDPDGDEISLEAVSSNTEVVNIANVGADGFTLQAYSSGTSQIEVYVTDTNGITGVMAFPVTVSGTNTENEPSAGGHPYAEVANEDNFCAPLQGPNIYDSQLVDDDLLCGNHYLALNQDDEWVVVTRYHFKESSELLIDGPFSIGFECTQPENLTTGELGTASCGYSITIYPGNSGNWRSGYVNIPQGWDGHTIRTTHWFFYITKNDIVLGPWDTPWSSNYSPTAVDGREIWSHCNQGGEEPCIIPPDIEYAFRYQTIMQIPGDTSDTSGLQPEDGTSSSEVVADNVAFTLPESWHATPGADGIVYFGSTREAAESGISNGWILGLPEDSLRGTLYGPRSLKTLFEMLNMDGLSFEELAQVLAEESELSFEDDYARISKSFLVEASKATKEDHFTEVGYLFDFGNGNFVLLDVFYPNEQMELYGPVLDAVTESLRLTGPSLPDSDEVTTATRSAQSQPLKVLTGTSEQYLLSVAVNDGGQIAAGGEGTVWVWDGASGDLLREFNENDYYVRSVVFNADGSRIAWASEDSKVHIWDYERNVEQLSLTVDFDISHMAWSRDESTLALATYSDRTVMLVNASTGEILHILYGHDDNVTAVAFGPDDRLVASSSHDGTVRLWDVSSGEMVRVFQFFDLDHLYVHDVTFSPDGKWIAAVGDYDNAILRVWDAATGMTVSRIVLPEGAERGDHLKLAFSRDNIIAVGMEDGSIGIWDAFNGSLLATWMGHDGEVLDIAFSPDGTLLASSGLDGTARLWNIAVGEASAVSPPASSDTASSGVIISVSANTEISIGSTVVINGLGGGSLTVMASPSIAADSRFEIADGDRFDVVDGPIMADGFAWWQLRDPGDPFRMGWMVAEYLTPADVSPEILPTSTPAPSATAPPVPTATYDGNTILIVSDRDGVNALYTLDLDTKAVTRLTDLGIPSFSGEYSPDGTQIVYTCEFRNGQRDICVMNADGSNVRRLTDDPAIDVYNSWSPDGRQIAFTSTREGKRELWVMDADGSNQHRLISYQEMGNVEVYGPRWSPDGEVIAFQSYSSSTLGDLWTIRPDGSGLAVLKQTDGRDKEMSWSPDGSLIAFTATGRGFGDNKEIFIMNADGSNERRLTNNSRSEQDRAPVFSPDGQRLIFHSDRDGNWEIYIMNLDGSGQRNLTNHSANDYVSDWGWVGGGMPTTTLVEPTATVTPTNTPSITPTATDSLANRLTAPPNAHLLTGGRGLTDGSPMDSGAFQVEWYCANQNYGIHHDEVDWFCTNRDKSIAFALTVQDFDAICQATYVNSNAIAIRDGDNSVLAYNWRCYESGN